MFTVDEGQGNNGKVLSRAMKAHNNKLKTQQLKFTRVTSTKFIEQQTLKEANQAIIYFVL